MNFIFGMILGGMLGVIITTALVVAKRADEWRERKLG